MRMDLLYNTKIGFVNVNLLGMLRLHLLVLSHIPKKFLFSPTFFALQLSTIMEMYHIVLGEDVIMHKYTYTDGTKAQGGDIGDAVIAVERCLCLLLFLFE